MKSRQTCHRAGCVPQNYAILLFAYLLSLPYLVALHFNLSLNSGIVTLIIMMIKIIIIIIIIIIVSITKLLIVIGSPRAYLSRNRRAITWVSDYRCPI